MSFQDHFNWPTASRGNTMYLSTINQQEPNLVKKTFFKDSSPNLDIGDIEKAKPFYHGYQHSNKEVYANRNDDIAGSHPKKLHQPLEKVYYGLRNDDISGSKPQCQKFTTVRASGNPLNPDYKLPNVEIRQATPPKFIRDNIAINDIEGAKPNPYTRYNIQNKTNNVEDIDGARPKKEWIPQGKQSSLNVKDINSFWEFHTKRQTDPLSPRYKVVNQENELYEYGKLDNKVAVRHPKEVNKPVSSDLRTTDITGAQAGTSTEHVTKLETRGTYIKTQDIPGAQTGTLKKGMATIRQSNPLWPVYQNPGHTEPGPVLTKNLKPSGSAQKLEVSSASKFESKTDFASPLGELNKIEEKAEIFPTIDTKNRRPSGAKTPSSSSQGEKRIPTPLARTGEGVLAYVPAKISTDNVETTDKNKQRAATSGMNFETKKALNANENYQKNVKNFFGLQNAADDHNKSSKPLSALEKFDKYIAK